MILKISKRDVEEFNDFDFSTYNDKEDHIELLDVIEDYIVEHFDDYSYSNIGDNTDFKILKDDIVVDLEVC